MYTHPYSRALADEAGLAAEHLAIGATALGRANYAHRAYYAQAFFALSIGLERSAKLAYVVEHALEHRGAFPTREDVKKHGHRLRELLDLSDKIASRRAEHGTPSDRLPDSDIHKGIVDVLHDFAINVTRYYNFDVVTGTGTAATQGPVPAWDKKVVQPVLALHYTGKKRMRVEANASIIESLLGGHALVRHTGVSGVPLDTVFEGSAATGEAEVAVPYCRMYVLQFARFFAHLMSDLTFEATQRRIEVIPYLSEFFAIFDNSDADFRKRKIWSIHAR